MVFSYVIIITESSTFFYFSKQNKHLIDLNWNLRNWSILIFTAWILPDVSGGQNENYLHVLRVQLPHLSMLVLRSIYVCILLGRYDNNPVFFVAKFLNCKYLKFIICFCCCCYCLCFFGFGV